MVEEHGLLTEKRMIPTRLVYGLYPEVVTNPGDKKTVLREIAESYLSRFQKSVTFEIGFWRKITSLSIIKTCDFSLYTSKVALSKLSEF